MPSFLPSFLGSCYQHQCGLGFQIKTKDTPQGTDMWKQTFSQLYPVIQALLQPLFPSYTNPISIPNWSNEISRSLIKTLWDHKANPRYPQKSHLSNISHFRMTMGVWDPDKKIKINMTFNFSWRSCAWHRKCLKQISQYHFKVTRWMSFTTELQVSLKEPIFISLSEIPALLHFFHI